MSDISKGIGENIKRLRKAKHITQRELADMYSERTGVAISANMISMWENGQRRLFADQVYYICRCLEITPTMVSPVPHDLDDSFVVRDIDFLKPQERRILTYMFNIWDGDPKAMIHFIGLYMSLPRQLRQDIAGMGLHMYQLGVRDHRLAGNAPEFDVKYLEEATEMLWDWKLSEM